MLLFICPVLQCCNHCKAGFFNLKFMNIIKDNRSDIIRQKFGKITVLDFAFTKDHRIFLNVNVIVEKFVLLASLI